MFGRLYPIYPFSLKGRWNRSRCELLVLGRRKIVWRTFTDILDNRVPLRRDDGYAGNLVY